MKDRRDRASRYDRRPVLEESDVYEERCLAELRAGGYRITMPRVQVIRALADTDTALSAYAIHDKVVKAGGKIDVVSVYRILATFQDIGLVHHVGLVSGFYPARLTDPRSARSEVAVCSNCGAVTELVLPDAIGVALEDQAVKAGIKHTSTKVELTVSACSKCKGK